MPRYDFRCGSCGLRFESVARVEGPWPQCPRCKSGTEKQFTPTGSLVVPPFMRAESDRQNDGSNQRWLDSPEVLAKLKSGEYRRLGKGDDASQHL